MVYKFSSKQVWLVLATPPATSSTTVSNGCFCQQAAWICQPSFHHSPRLLRRSSHWLMCGNLRINLHFLLLPFRFPPPPEKHRKRREEGISCGMVTSFYSFIYCLHFLCPPRSFERYKWGECEKMAGRKRRERENFKRQEWPLGRNGLWPTFESQPTS